MSVPLCLCASQQRVARLQQRYSQSAAGPGMPAVRGPPMGGMGGGMGMGMGGGPNPQGMRGYGNFPGQGAFGAGGPGQGFAGQQPNM